MNRIVKKTVSIMGLFAVSVLLISNYGYAWHTEETAAAPMPQAVVPGIAIPLQDGNDDTHSERSTLSSGRTTPQPSDDEFELIEVQDEAVPPYLPEQPHEEAPGEIVEVEVQDASTQTPITDEHFRRLAREVVNTGRAIIAEEQLERERINAASQQ